MVLNKIDQYREKNYDAYLASDIKEQIERELKERLQHEFGQEAVMISAVTGENLDLLRSVLTRYIEEAYAIRYPYRIKEW
jgi:GTP-binding protein HflX